MKSTLELIWDLNEYEKFGTPAEIEEKLSNNEIMIEALLKMVNDLRNKKVIVKTGNSKSLVKQINQHFNDFNSFFNNNEGDK